MWEKQKKDRFGAREKDLFLAEGGAFGLLARAAAHGQARVYFYYALLALRRRIGILARYGNIIGAAIARYA